ncbi:hypothetical protein MAR_008050 [Mya arenaria]|uniref:Mutator-like transposase domain-containing protein n=1 Tax=Mya arenaria TaxID=6604 RepID=A0ABY7DUT7_MYAAR|nr:hypothetical protein MAR_008050 [Mya arenaria]
MFGGLHIELAALKTIGDLLQDSGWSSVLTQANIATPGTADSFLKATNISRTRHAHQVTAAALYVLMKQQYDEYVEATKDEIGPEMSLEMWVDVRQNESPMFLFWALILTLELTSFTFIRSLREGNFQLYVNSLIELVPWLFALDRNNYARWIPVHIKDMLLLKKNVPVVATEFEKGHFCLKKTARRFSALPLDQAHEQNNKLIKDDGGAVGLTENPAHADCEMGKMRAVAGEDVLTIARKKKSGMYTLSAIKCNGCGHAKTYAKEPPNHDCFKNWSASSQSMESDIILDGFLSCEFKNAVRHIVDLHDLCSSDFCKHKIVKESVGNVDHVDDEEEEDNVADDEEEEDVIINQMADKADRLIGNFTNNLAESWMNIRCKFDGRDLNEEENAST